MRPLKFVAPLGAAAALVLAAAMPAQAVTPGVHTDPAGDVVSFGYHPVHTATKKAVVSSVDLTRVRVVKTNSDVIYRIHFAPALHKAKKSGATVELWLLFDKELREGELSATKQINFVDGKVKTVGPRYITTSWNAKKHLAIFRVPVTRLKGYQVGLQAAAVWDEGQAQYADTMKFGKE